MLPVVPYDLGEQLWRVDFEVEPSLLVNKAVGDWRAVSLSPGFVALVYPAVLREVLTRTLLFEKHFDLDDPEEPLSRWLRFASLLPGMGEPPTGMKAWRRVVTGSKAQWLPSLAGAGCWRNLTRSGRRRRNEIAAP